MLLIEYSHFNHHFLQWNIWTLAKDISFSIFLSIVRFSKISYNIWVSLIWVVSALFAIYGINKFLTNNKLLLLFSFIFILFLPFGFDFHGIRIYRNSIIVPVMILFLFSLFIFINFSIEKLDKNTVIWGVLTGLLFVFYYYIKEDGITTLPILLVSIFLIIIYRLFKDYNDNSINAINVAKCIVVCMLPIIIFAVATVAYEEVNYQYFGVHEVNTRTSGELGTFYANLLKIEDSNKNRSVWIPLSTFEKAVNASPTLSAHPELIDKYNSSGWVQGNAEKNPLRGDHFTWAFRNVLWDAGLFNNEKSANDLFKQVNSELDAAFNNGSLQKSNKIFITSSLIGKDINEIFDLKPLLFKGLKTTLFFEDFNLQDQPYNITSQTNDTDEVRSLESVLNQKVSFNGSFSESQKSSISFAQFDIKVYQELSILFIILSALGFLGLFINQFINKFKNMRLNMLLIFEILIIGSFAVQIFAITWFMSWFPVIGNYFVFYTVGCQGLLAVFEVLAIVQFFILFKKFLDWKFLKDKNC